MSFLGKKDKTTDAPAEDFDDTGAATPGELAATGRPGAGRKGGGGKALLLLLLLVSGGLGGGYYYFMMMEAESFTPPQAAQNQEPQPVAAATADMPPPPADITSATDTANAGVIAAPIDAGAAAPVTADAAAPDAAMTAPDAPADISGTTPAAAPVTAENAPAADSAAVTTTNGATAEPEDLPVPPGTETLSLPPEAAASPVVIASDEQPPEAALPPVEPAQAPVVAAPEAAPTPAEKALAENAPVLDGMSGARDAAPAPLPVQEAIVRPLPETYIVVKKNSSGESADARLGAARAALAADRNTAALQLFNEMDQKYPGDSRVLMGRAIALQRLGQNEGALAAYEAVLEREPRNLEALTNMLGLVKAQDPALARARLEELREAYPSNADITAQLGIACGGMGDYPNALKYLDMADALAPGSATVAFNKAVVYDRMGDSAKAAPLYRAVLERAAAGGATGQLPLDAIRKRLGELR